MFAATEKREEFDRPELKEDVSREDIVAAFRSAMITHFRSHIPGTNINETTLLASDYLNHFHELLMLIEAVSSDPDGFTEGLLGWHPITYEEHFTSSGFRHKILAIAAYRRAPPKIRARFDDAVAKLHGEAVTLLADLAGELKTSDSARLRKQCADGVARLRVIIDEANTIATGESSQDRFNLFSDLGGQGAADAIFKTR
jgi:hypothetical protein